MNEFTMDELLSRLAELLRLGSDPVWAKVLEHWSDTVRGGAETPDAGTLLSTGGAVFLNNIVLQVPGRILLEENREFVRLRSRLHSLCQERWPEQYPFTPDTDDWFADMTNYSRHSESYPRHGVKYVGWLDVLGEYRTGDVPGPTLQKLKTLAGSTGIFRPLVERGRHAPVCRACGELIWQDADGKWLPDAELWIPGDDVLYVSPISLIHYIEVHRYLPPGEYLNAVAQIDIHHPFDGEAAAMIKLEESGWFDRPR